MNAIDLLKQDHRKVKGLFQQIERTDDGGQQRDLFNQIARELQIHTRIEEEVFYPTMKEISATREMVLESLQEHHQVDVLLNELSQMEPGGGDWSAKITVLKEDVDHHVKEEEEELFPKAQELCDQQQLQAMAEQMEQIKATA